jgi:hypothetical protein
LIKIDSDKYFLKFLFIASGVYSFLIIITNFFNISIFGDYLLIFITMGFFFQITPIYYNIMKIQKKSTYKLIILNCIFLAYTLYIILIILTVFSRNSILAVFELFFLIISVGCIKAFISFKKKDNSKVCRILLRIEFIIILLLSSIIFILNFLEHNCLILFISLTLLLGGCTNLLYSIIWKFKNG